MSSMLSSTSACSGLVISLRYVFCNKLPSSYKFGGFIFRNVSFPSLSEQETKIVLNGSTKNDALQCRCSFACVRRRLLHAFETVSSGLIELALSHAIDYEIVKMMMLVVLRLF